MIQKIRHCCFDMYPQYWTPSIGGIVMKYSYEYKLKCIDLYRQGKWPELPEGIKEENFSRAIKALLDARYEIL